MAAGIYHRHAARGWGCTSTVACRSWRRVCSCAFACVIMVSRLACFLSGFGFLFGLLSGGVAFLLVRFAALPGQTAGTGPPRTRMRVNPHPYAPVRFYCCG